MKKLLSILLFIVLYTFAYSQTKLPQIIPPSPQSRAFQRYGEYPVNYNTGIPDISIPLYTVKSGSIEIPIILRYYASGIKPNEPDMSNIGSGWTLDMGGLVTRTVEGKPDELFAKPFPMKTPDQINQENQDDIYYLDNILQKTTGNDSRYDRFSYSLGDRHGSFAMEDDQSGNFTAYNYPFVPYKINVHTAAPTDAKYYRSISGIDITDDKGVNYQFGYNNTESVNDSYNFNITGWYLEKVSDPSNTNQVDFTYKDIPVFGWGVNVGSVQIHSGGASGDNGVPLTTLCSQPNQSGNPDPQGTNSINYGGASYQTKNIQSITFPNGHIQFNLDASKQHITSMIIYKSDNSVLKTITFNQDNFPGSTNQFRLNSIQISGTTAPVEQYTFSYDLMHPVADNRCLVDQWGYCRGEAELTAVTMRRTVQAIRDQFGQTAGPYNVNISVGDQDFTPNEDYMKRYILNKIQYPTGGTSEFVYEGNKYLDITNQTGGGLRIKQIISKDGGGNTLVKSYDYDPGFLEYPLSKIEFSTQCGFDIVPECSTISAGGQVSFPNYYIFRTRSLVNGWNGDLGSNAVFYKRITEYTGDATSNNGKTIYGYTYDNPNQASISAISSGVKGIFMPNYYLQTYKNWGNGLLKTKETYRNTGNNAYQKIQDITNNYQFVNLKTLSGLYVYIVATYSGYSSELPSIFEARNNLSTLTQPYMDKSLLLQGASVNTQSIVTGAYYLQSTVENNYEGALNSTVNTIYEHNNPNHYYPTRTIRDLSSGEKSVTTFSYVDEFSGNAPYNTMKGLNIVAPVVETKNYVRNTANADRFVSGIKTDYKQWNGVSEYLPQTVSTSAVEGTYQPRLNYDNYDKTGNITSIHNTAGPNKVYLWSYNNQFPVLEIDNVGYAAVESAMGGATAVANFGASNPNPATVNNTLAALKAVLPDAQITTYTYDPLIGMTSTIDAKGIKTTYEYDQFQRLMNIRDKDNNIIKHIDYHYQGQ